MRRDPRLLILLASALPVPGTGCDSAAGPMIRVVNADTVTLDRVMLDAGGSAYALGRLPPGTAGQVVPAPAPDSQVLVRHHGAGPFVVRERFSGARVVEIRLTADSVAAVQVKRE